MRTSTSLRWRSASSLSTADAWSWSRCTRIAATICGCSLRSSSATAPASIHFRLSMPVTSPPCRMRSSSRLALSSPSALRSTARTYSSVSPTSMLCSAATVVKAAARLPRVRAGSTSCARWSRPGSALPSASGASAPRRRPPRRATSAGSRRSPGRSSSMRAHGRSASRRRFAAADPAAHDAGHGGRVLAAPSAWRGRGARSGAAAAATARAAPAARPTTALSRRAGQRRAAAASTALQRRAGPGRRRPAAPTSASAAGHGGGAQQVERLRLLPQRQSCDRRQRLDPERRVDHLDRIAALCLEADALAHQRGQLVELLGAERDLASSCPWRR